MAARACIAQVEFWSLAHHREEQGEFVFEHGGPEPGGLVKAMSLHLELPSPHFEQGRDIPDGKGGTLRGMAQLQAADVLAYELRKHKAEFRERSNRPAIRSLYILMNSRSLFMVSLNQMNMPELCLLDQPDIGK